MAGLRLGSWLLAAIYPSVTLESRTVSKDRENNPDSRGFLCIRGQATQEIFENPKRLLQPLRRVGERGEDRWERCSWDEAYALIVDAIQRTQPERVGLWRGHGIGTTGPTGTMLVSRLGLLGGFQLWSSSIVCWAVGGYGLGLTGTLRTNTKEDMAANSRTIVLWGATLASQPDLGPHLVEARKRGAYVVQIDMRRTEASRHADEVLLLRPGSDAALALALAQVILEEGLHDQEFIECHTLGFAPFAAHVQSCTPEWAAAITGIEPERIRTLARRYATDAPAMIVLGGSVIKGVRLDELRKVIAQGCRFVPWEKTELALASLGEDANLIGGASVWQNRYGDAAKERAEAC